MSWHPDHSAKKHSSKRKRRGNKPTRSLLGFPLLTRVVIYGGLTLSLAIAIRQQFTILRPGSTALSRDVIFQRALKLAAHSYEESNIFPAPELINSPGSHVLRRWTTSIPDEQGSGPQQVIAGQPLLPHRGEGVILTMDTERQHFLGAAYVGENHEAIRIVSCQGDRPFKPTDISITDLKLGEPIDCPEGATRLDLD
ncbi:MAG: hypothetical protein WBA57_27730 [Elainellaceae cyanobacterium]